MSNDENNQDKKKRQVLPVVSLIAYTLGAVFLFLAPQNIFLSPEVALPAAGLTSPIFFSMLLLATTSAVLVATVFQKDRKLKATKKFTGKNIEGDVERINESVLLRKEQSKKEFNKFTYIISFLSMTFAIIQAWKIFYMGIASGISIVYWGAYLAIAAAWFGYGLYYKNKIVMITSGVWIILEITIINGLLFYTAN
ncbi:hypothetical protein J4233_04810 [Candidatus Pacearchaeota archaeon]|nr:hypothetical protein [Candidatus Pacearchaeota archaeon]